MKTQIKLLALIALSLAACKKSEIAAPTQELTVNFIADNTLTRTSLDGDTAVIWNESGEYITVLQEDGNEELTIAQSAEAVVTDGKASFATSFSEAEGPFVYNAVYPAASYVSGPAKAVYLKLPAEQKPSSTSFDSAADLLLAKQINSATINSTELLSFKRSVALAKMKITNVTGIMDYILFSVEDDAIAGTSSFNLTTGEAIAYGVDNSSSEIKINYRGKGLNANDLVAYFTLFPCTLHSGDTFTVTVVTSNNTYKKTITLDEDFTFSENALKKMTIDMTNCEQPVSFPVVFPLGYPTTNPSSDKDCYNYPDANHPWMLEWNSGTNYGSAKASTSFSGEGGKWHCMTQPQAYISWNWADNSFFLTTKNIRHYTETAYTRQFGGEYINTGSPGVKGVWNGDFWEIVLPVANINAGDNIRLSAPLYTSGGGQALWNVKYYDGGEWKQTDQEEFTINDCRSGNEQTITTNATWMIHYEKHPATQSNEKTITFSLANPIVNGFLKIRIECVNAMWYAWPSTPGGFVGGTAPYAASGVATGALYFHNPYAAINDPASHCVKIEIAEP